MAIIFFLLALSALVIIHELGHYFAARIFGIGAEEFGFGFPPRIIGIVKDGGKWKIVGGKDQKEYKKTIWSLNWLPLGGFVRIKGEQEGHEHDADSILMKPIWQRVIVIGAGVFMNWLLAATLFTALFAIGTTAYLDALPAGALVQNAAISVTEVLPGSPADTSGIQAGDKIVSLDGTTSKDANSLSSSIGQSGTRVVLLVVNRNGQQKTFSVTPTYLKEVGHTGIGIGLADVGTVSLPFFSAVKNGVLMTWELTKDIVLALGGMLGDLFIHHQVPQDVSGPVGIAVIASDVAKQGIAPFIQFAAILSINLAVINLLPIPALDGGRILFLIIEKIRRKPMKRNVEIGIYNVAFFVLIALVLLVTVHDLGRYGGEIVGGAKSLVGM
ncbi:MAG: RIP metalloprotease RseP [Patescibacteria group bacterium]